MKILTLQWYIENRLLGEDPAVDMARIWNIILTWIYPIGSGYTTGPEASVGEGSSAFSTRHMIFGAGEFTTLIVQCRPPEYETDTSTWNDCVVQLSDQLCSVAADVETPRLGGIRHFGAIAIGRLVRFYEWKRDEQRIQNVASNDACFYVDRQCETVTHWLDYFRDHHRW